MMPTARNTNRRNPKNLAPVSPQAKRRQRSATAAVRRGTTLMQSDVGRRVESRLAPPRRAERQHARPGAGIKRSRASMAPRAQRSRRA